MRQTESNDTQAFSPALSVVRVLCNNADVGLGFFLDSDLIVTCLHVTQRGKGCLSIRIADNHRPVQVVHPDQNHDLAFLRLREATSGFSPVPLRLKRGAKAGTEVQFVGWSDDQSSQIQRTELILHPTSIRTTATITLGTPSRQMQVHDLDEDCPPGYSGGPLVFAGTGYVCGMVVGRDKRNGKGFAIYESVLEDGLRAACKECGKVLPPILDTPFSDMPVGHSGTFSATPPSSPPSNHTSSVILTGAPASLALVAATIVVLGVAYFQTRQPVEQARPRVESDAEKVATEGVASADPLWPSQELEEPEEIREAKQTSTDKASDKRTGGLAETESGDNPEQKPKTGTTPPVAQKDSGSEHDAQHPNERACTPIPDVAKLVLLHV